MFSKTVYQAANEGVRHKEQREQLTQQFHRNLKILQQKEHVDGAIIVSTEASNNLCSVLEAVFLHGVKDNMMSKLVSYAQGVTTEVKLNFWSVAKKFTHKNVIEQLKELSQINSDIGLCRAWVRLAINDGLMASYLASMMADGKAMKTFYQDWAYLLDYEQPDILRNHLTGLMGLRFQLSLNSSVLNTWSTMTINLAGLAPDHHCLAPVIPSGNPSPPSSRRQSQASNASADFTSARADSLTSSVTTTTTTSSLTTLSPSVAVPFPLVAGVTSTPPNTPADPAFFSTVHDVDVLKRFGGGLQSSSVSSSSSGQASCPDPGESFDTGGRFSTRSSRSNSPHVSPYQSLRYMSREDRKRDEETMLKGILQHWDQKELEREQAAQRREETEREKAEQKLQKKAVREAKKQRQEGRRKKHEAQEREVKVVQESPGESQADKSADRESGERESGERENGEHRQAREEEATSGQPPQDRVQQEKAKASEDLTSPTPGGAEGAQGTASSVTEPQPQDEVDLCLRQGEEEEEEEGWKERESSYGNSLNAMDGWTTTSPYAPHHRHGHLQQQATFDQSYESMLKGYHAQQGADSGMATVQKVLDNLPDAKSPVDKDPFTAGDMSDDDIDFTDYEIIHSPEEAADTVKVDQMKSLCNFLGKNAQSNTCATPSCNMGVGFFHGPGQICNFDGKTYCEQCHRAQYAYIPAEIVFNWNFKKKKVCQENYKFLQRVQDQPLLDMEEMSSNIYATVPLINTIMLLRTQLTSLRSYMFTCSESTASQLKDRVWPREHLYNKVHTYSLNDLLEVRSGKLEAFLKDTVDMCTKHVYSCALCMAKGFYCELCQDSVPIFPFQVNTTVKCNVCKNVYHSKCKTEAIPCPKCVRFAQRGVRRKKDGDDDYACSPDS